MVTRIEADWLRDPVLQSLLAALSEGGEEARIVGGAIRNHLMGRAICDIDIATTTPPAETVRRVEAAAFRAVPTGLDHGTVTAVREGRAFEVTTLRRDVDTDGRHATVAFGRDWQADAERRDFTINALTCSAAGEVIDLVGGVADIENGVLRFIGDAASRIEEDYLRILRFFRFFAWYGGGRPDGEGLRAATRLKAGLARLSPERVWGEMRKTLAAPDPSRTLLWMRQTGVLTLVLPESEKWGIDAVHGLVEAERARGVAPDPMARLQSIVPPDAARMTVLAKRLRLSNEDRGRLVAWAKAEAPRAEESDSSFAARLYFGDRRAVADRLLLALASLQPKAAGDPELLPTVALYARRLAEAQGFSAPAFPLTGHDLSDRGVEAGPDLGAKLASLKKAWAESGFVLDRDALLAMI